MKEENNMPIVSEAWNEIEIIVNSDINELCNQNRYSDAQQLENCRDIVKVALKLSGHIVD